MPTIKPYKHDCKKCKWVTWIKLAGDRWANMYVHLGGWAGTMPGDWRHEDTTIVLRLSDEPGDVLTYVAGDDVLKLSIETSIPSIDRISSEGPRTRGDQCSSDIISTQEKNVPLKRSPTRSSGKS